MTLAGRVLVLGFGNPGRQDDGLGPAAAEAIDRVGFPNIRVETNYMLNIEDAALIAEYDAVVFVDAAETGAEPFALNELTPADGATFTTHLVKPEVVLAICRQHYSRTPVAYLMAIRGYEFELEERLTERARANLEQAVCRLRSMLGGMP